MGHIDYWGTLVDNVLTFTIDCTHMNMSATAQLDLLNNEAHRNSTADVTNYFPYSLLAIPLSSLTITQGYWFVVLLSYAGDEKL